MLMYQHTPTHDPGGARQCMYGIHKLTLAVGAACQVWPWNTYASLAFMLPAGVLAEAYGYRAVILGGLLAREATRLLLLFAASAPAMALMQVTYSGATAAQTVYFAYVYLAAAPADFALATAGVRASYKLGNVVGSLFGQLLVDRAAAGSSVPTLRRL